MLMIEETRANDENNNNFHFDNRNVEIWWQKCGGGNMVEIPPDVTACFSKQESNY